MKLKPETRAEIKRRWDDLPLDARNISAFAREYKVTRQYIQFIVYPERYQRMRDKREKRERRKHV